MTHFLFAELLKLNPDFERHTSNPRGRSIAGLQSASTVADPLKNPMQSRQTTPFVSQVGASPLVLQPRPRWFLVRGIALELVALFL